MSQKMFALIKWIGGQDDKKYTPDVPVSWIKGFNIEEFESDTFDPSLSYVIEWHSTKKMPQGGWPVYDGYVIAVSRSITTLQNKLTALYGLLSPKCKTSEIENSMSNQTGTGSNDEKTESSKEKRTNPKPIDGGSNGESSKNGNRGKNTGKPGNSNSSKPETAVSSDQTKKLF